MPVNTGISFFIYLFLKCVKIIIGDFMKKFLNNIAIIQIIICVICFFTMYFPVVKVTGGTINGESFNAFYAIKGVKTGSVYIFKFSFWNLFPYLLLIVIVGLDIFLDNKKRLYLHIIKLILFLTSTIMIFLFLRLMNPGDVYINVSDMLEKAVKPMYGHYITASFCLLGAITTILEILKDVDVIK